MSSEGDAVPGESGSDAGGRARGPVAAKVPEVTVLWQTHTHVRGSRLQVTATGVLRVVAPNGHLTWSSRSGEHSTSTVLSVRGLGLHQYAPRDRIVWHVAEPWQSPCG